MIQYFGEEGFPASKALGESKTIVRGMQFLNRVQVTDAEYMEAGTWRLAAPENLSVAEFLSNTHDRILLFGFYNISDDHLALEDSGNWIDLANDIEI